MKDKKYLELASQLGCLVCKNNGYPDTTSELHHVRIAGETGTGYKASDRRVVALCPIHHRTGGYGEVGYHQSPKEFEKRYGTQEELLEQMKKEVEKLKEMYIL